MSQPGGRTTTVVCMGVSGSGKTTVARELVSRLGWAYAEGDDFHPQANVEKMRSGQPLDDEDRWPWLGMLAGWIGDRESAGEDAVMTCSALRRAYRDVLADGHPSVRFLHLDEPAERIAERVTARQGHYMPASLLQSQLDTLEPLQDDEAGVTLPADGTVAEITAAALTALDIAAPPATAPQEGERR